MDTSLFHQSVGSLGFVSLDGFQLHRLLKEEIVRLCHFTGDDQWNLILKVNECEELVHVIETKHVSSWVF